MFTGIHVLFYTTNPEADRAFLRDILELNTVDIGHGWLIFGMPPAEAAVHPIEGDFPAKGMTGAHVYFMCADLKTTMATLSSKGVTCTAVHEERWGIVTTIPFPSGGEIGLYQPKHPTAI